MRKFITVLAVLVLRSIPMCHANLLTNADFNTPDTEWWINIAWTAWGREGDEDIACYRLKDADRAGNGRGAVAQGWKSPRTVGFHQDVTVTLGLTYTFSIWVRKNAGYTESNTDIKIEWLDAGRAHLGSVITNITGQAGTNYTKFKISGSTDSDRCKYIRVVAATAWSNAMPKQACSLTTRISRPNPAR